MTIGSRKFSVEDESGKAPAQPRDTIWVRPYQEIMVTKGGKSKDLAPPVCITRDLLAQPTEGSRKAFNGTSQCGGLDRPAWQCKGYIRGTCTSKPISKCEFIHCDITPEMAAEAARQADERTQKEKPSRTAPAFDEQKPPADSLASRLGDSLASRWPQKPKISSINCSTNSSSSTNRFSREKLAEENPTTTTHNFHAPSSHSSSSSHDLLSSKSIPSHIESETMRPTTTTGFTNRSSMTTAAAHNQHHDHQLFPSDPLLMSSTSSSSTSSFHEDDDNNFHNDNDDDLDLSLISNESGFSWEQESKMETISGTPCPTLSPRSSSSPVPANDCLATPLTAHSSFEFPSRYSFQPSLMDESEISKPPSTPEPVKRTPVFPRPAIPRRASSTATPDLTAVSPSLSPHRPPPLSLNESFLNSKDEEMPPLMQPSIPQTLVTTAPCFSSREQQQQQQTTQLPAFLLQSGGVPFIFQNPSTNSSSSSVGPMVFFPTTKPTTQSVSAPNSSVWPFAVPMYQTGISKPQPQQHQQQQQSDELSLLDLSPLLMRYAADPLDPINSRR